MTEKQIAQRHFPPWLFIVSFLFFAFVMWCAPYSSDDLEFAALEYNTLGEYLTYVLQYGNGRVLGNISAIVLSHSKVLCILVKAFLLASSVVLISTIMDFNSIGEYMAVFLLFVMIDPSVFGEVYVWTSGFSNYFPPIWMTLVIIVLLKKYHGYKSSALRLLVCILIFLMGIASQLFIEHSSGINFLLALAFTCFSLRQKKRCAAPCVIWLVATAVGMAVMLLRPKFFYISGNHTETYRSVNMNTVTEMVYTCAKNAVQLCGHYFGVCLLPVCFGSVATVFLTRDRRTEKKNHVLYAMGTISILYLLVSMFLTAANYLGKSALIQHAIDCIFTVLPLATWFFASFRLDKRLREPVLFCLGFALIAIAPLLVVTPIPTRVIYQSYVFVLLAAVQCFAALFLQFDQKIRGHVQAVTRVVCLLLVLVIGSAFLSIHFMADIRDRYIRQELAAGSKEIAIFQLPYEYTTWDHLWSQKYAYGAGDDVTFNVVDFDGWMHSYY